MFGLGLHLAALAAPPPTAMNGLIFIPISIVYVVVQDCLGGSSGTIGRYEYPNNCHCPIPWSGREMLPMHGFLSNQVCVF